MSTTPNPTPAPQPDREPITTPIANPPYNASEHPPAVACPGEEGVRNAAVLAAVLSVVLVGVIGLMAWDANVALHRELDPQHRIDHAERLIRENYPEFRAMLARELRDQSPQVAAYVSQEALEATPEAREWLEQVASRQIDAGLRRGTAFSANQFRQMLRTHREDVIALYETAEELPQNIEHQVSDAERRLEEAWGVDLRRQTEGALEVHRAVNAKLERLAERDAELSEQEQIELRLVRIVRALEEEHVPDLQSQLPEPPALPARR